jgi:hypothetical protein
MINKPRLSTVEAPQRYGGLLVCGLNYGLPKGGSPQPEGDFPPCAPYFTHDCNRKADKFVSRIASWFEWWGIPLETPDGTPTELNQAISQTNLFYDSSKSFSARSSDEVSLAFKRVRLTAERLNISGLLLAAVGMADAARAELNLPDWDTLYAGKFSLRQASSGKLRVAVCPHPRNPQSHDDVKGVETIMRAWIASIMDEYRIRQAEQTPAGDSLKAAPEE